MRSEGKSGMPRSARIESRMTDLRTIDTSASHSFISFPQAEVISPNCNFATWEFFSFFLLVALPHFSSSLLSQLLAAHRPPSSFLPFPSPPIGIKGFFRLWRIDLLLSPKSQKNLFKKIEKTSIKPKTFLTNKKHPKKHTKFQNPHVDKPSSFSRRLRSTHRRCRHHSLCLLLRPPTPWRLRLPPPLPARTMPTRPS
jgi:hypothetical protein